MDLFGDTAAILISIVSKDIMVCSTLGARGIFFSRSQRTLSDSKSTVEDKKKFSGRTTPEPHFHVIKLGQNLYLFADWTLCSRELLIGQIKKPVLKSCCDKQGDFGPRRKGQTVSMVRVLLQCLHAL